MSREVIKLNLIPKGEMPVFHASQFDIGRLITCELYNGEDAYNVPSGYTVELHCRKVDNNIVTMASTTIDDNVVKFTSTEQLTACNGKNLCEVAILDDGYRIGTLNFWLEVEIDPLKGGINSTSEIHDLYDQVEEITTEVIGDDYYNKTQVDELLDTKADKSDTYTKTQVDTLLTAKADKSNTYTKAETNTLLSAKADADDVYTKGQIETKLAAKADAADVYTKDETDILLDAKANANGVYSKVEVDAMVDDLEDAIDLKADQSTTYTKTEIDTALALKANAADVYTKSEVYNKTETYTQAQVDALIASIFPTKTATGDIASFTTALALHLVSCTVAESATTVTRCGVNLWDETWEQGGIDDSTGNNVIANNVIRSTGYIKVEPDMVVYFPTNTRKYYYDASKNYLGHSDNSGGSFTIPTNTYYLRIRSNAGYGNVYLNDMGVNFPATVITYQAYSGQTVPKADATTLTTQSGVNNVFADSDVVTLQYKDTTL